jgi:hypothetical protein
MCSSYVRWHRRLIIALHFSSFDLSRTSHLPLSLTHQVSSLFSLDYSISSIRATHSHIDISRPRPTASSTIQTLLYHIPLIIPILKEMSQCRKYVTAATLLLASAPLVVHAVSGNFAYLIDRDGGGGVSVSSVSTLLSLDKVATSYLCRGTSRADTRVTFLRAGFGKR